MNIILSIKPKYVTEIIAGRKRYEFRKTIFKQTVEKVYIYSSAPVSKVVGEFQPVDILQDSPEAIWKKTKYASGLTKAAFDKYFAGKDTAYAIVIQNLIIYDTPKILPFRAPQSFCYVESL